jgi:hypothetical protein
MCQHSLKFTHLGSEANEGLIEFVATPACVDLPLFRKLEVPDGSSHSRFNQFRAFHERCPRMPCSTNSSPNRLVNGPKPNKKR